MAFFRRKPKLKATYDAELLRLMNILKDEWEQARALDEMVKDYDEQVIAQRKIAESKYFYLFKEAKERKMNMK